MLAGLAVTCGAVITLAFMADKNPLKGIDYDSIDKAVSPQDDFYHYANGNWLKNNPVPADQSRWGSFDVLADENNKKIRVVVEEVAADKKCAPGSLRQKLHDFYLLAIDSMKAEKQGISLIQPDLGKIAAVASKKEVAKQMAILASKGVDNAFGFYVGRDLKNSSSNVLYLSQSGLGLPDRDYYLKTDERNENYRKAYVEHMTKMLTLINYANPKQTAENILALETELAKVSMSRVEMRDEEKTYNPRTYAELMQLTASFDWNGYTLTNAIPTTGKIIVSQPEYFKSFSAIYDSVSVDSWKAYMTWHYITTFANELNSAFVTENFNFYSKTLNGAQVMRPRWKRALGACDASIGEIVGQMYIQKYFSREIKVRVEGMVKNILEAYKIRINNLDWMSKETKVKAQEKLSRFNTKLGYTEKWKDYSKLNIKNDAFVLNMIRAEEFSYKEMMDKLGKPVDKTEWQMLPHQVNAYYEPTLNEIVFPAAIMQPPFYYPEADDATNYGSLGAVIGHEITHGFDDQGSKYDGSGNMIDWWTDNDRKLFDEKSKVLIDCFNKFEALPTVFVNGELTIGENIADLGGLSTAYLALQMSRDNKLPVIINGYNEEQRFFLAFSQVWKQNIKEEMLRKRILTDVHSPANFRVLGTLANMPEFYQAFGIKEGNGMYRSSAERAKIW